MTDAEKIRILRKELNMKQGEFSREISTTQGHISDIENGRKYTLIKEFLINYQKSDSKTQKVLDTYLNNVLEGYQKRKEGN